MKRAATCPATGQYAAGRATDPRHRHVGNRQVKFVELGRLGFRVVDTDFDPWTEWSEVEDGYMWREDAMTRLLSEADERSLYVSGTVSNQGRFYAWFDAVVLLSAPAEVILRRVENRTTNPYGKSQRERELILRHLEEVEPLLRMACTHEIDASQPLASVVRQLTYLGREPS